MRINLSTGLRSNSITRPINPNDFTGRFVSVAKTVLACSDFPRNTTNQIPTLLKQAEKCVQQKSNRQEQARLNQELQSLEVNENFRTLKREVKNANLIKNILRAYGW